METDPKIKLFDPDGKSLESLSFGLGVNVDKWKDKLVVCWVHSHRLVGLISDESWKAALENKPFYLHQVCTWISQIGIMPHPQGTQVQSARAIVRYDNAGAVLDKMRVTQNSAVLRVSDQDKDLQTWVLVGYKHQVLPSDIQVTDKMPPEATS